MILSCRLILSKLVQFLNKLSDKKVNSLGIFIVVKDEHLLKAPISIKLIDLGKYNDSKELQL